MATSARTLPPSVLVDMFVESKKQLSEHVDYLNKINVFPVADGDTGINMLMTMEKVVSHLVNSTDTSMASLAKSLMDGAFEGAKGNSGIILSQFLIGLCEELGKGEDIGLESFSKGMTKGADRAYGAVLNPREGTMISVMRDTAESGIEFVDNWHDYLDATFNAAQESIRQSPEQLAVLKKAGVMDSGAIGFLYIYQGWINVMSKQLSSSDTWIHDSSIDKSEGSIDGIDSAESIEHRFCTEGRFSSQLPEEQVRSLLGNFGDSFLLLKRGQNGRVLFKIHVHTNTPLEVFRTLKSSGEVQYFKVDDMMVQTLSSH